MPPVATEMLPMVAHALDLSDGVLAVVERALARRGAHDATAIADVLRAVECDRLFREAFGG